MIDRSKHDTFAIKAARTPFAQALMAAGLLEPFRNCDAGVIDGLIEAAVTGYQEALQGLGLDDEIPF